MSRPTLVPAPEHGGRPLEIRLRDQGERPIALHEVAYHLQIGDAIRVHLEPGDMTRYTFLLGSPDANIYAIRLRGYDVVGAACLPSHHVVEYETEGLVPNQDPYVHAIMHWFFNHLIDAYIELGETLSRG